MQRLVADKTAHKRNKRGGYFAHWSKKTNKAFHKEQMAREDTAYDRNCFSDNTVLKITSYVRLSSP